MVLSFLKIIALGGAKRCFLTGKDLTYVLSWVPPILLLEQLLVTGKALPFQLLLLISFWRPIHSIYFLFYLYTSITQFFGHWTHATIEDQLFEWLLGKAPSVLALPMGSVTICSKQQSFLVFTNLVSASSPEVTLLQFPQKWPMSLTYSLLLFLVLFSTHLSPSKYSGYQHCSSSIALLCGNRVQTVSAKTFIKFSRWQPYCYLVYLTVSFFKIMSKLAQTTLPLLHNLYPGIAVFIHCFYYIRQTFPLKAGQYNRSIPRFFEKCLLHRSIYECEIYMGTSPSRLSAQIGLWFFTIILENNLLITDSLYSLFLTTSYLHFNQHLSCVWSFYYFIPEEQMTANYILSCFYWCSLHLKNKHSKNTFDRKCLLMHFSNIDTLNPKALREH